MVGGGAVAAVAAAADKEAGPDTATGVSLQGWWGDDGHDGREVVMVVVVVVVEGVLCVQVFSCNDCAVLVLAACGVRSHPRTHPRTRALQPATANTPAQTMCPSIN